MIYFIVLLAMLFCVYAFDLRRHQTLYQFSYWGFFVVLVLIAGLRYRIGTDSIVYENFYPNVPKLWELAKYNFDSNRMEPGFMVFASIPRSFSSDFIWLQFMVSIIVNGVIFWFIYKNTKHRFLCLTFYFVVLYLNLNTQVLREALAVSLFLLAWPAFRDGKWWLYYALTILASFMHTSALFTLILPLFCLPGIRELFVVGKRTIIILLAILALGMFIQSRFSEVFNLMAFTQRAMDRVNEYSKNAWSTSFLNIFGIIATFFQYALYPLIAIYFANAAFRYKYNREKRSLFSRRKEGKKNEESKIRDEVKALKKETREFDRWQMMVLLGVYIMVFSISMFIFRRYFNYFGIFCLATVADWAFRYIVVNRRKIRLKSALWVAILLPWFFYNIYSYTTPVNKSGTLKTYQIYYPYTSRLNPEMDQKREAIYRYLDAR